ncbi:MAG: hypothetical protein ACFE95_02615 [Candidatus Hodarchaeota archaeon]
MTETSPTITTEIKTGKEIVYGTASSSITLEVPQGDVKITITAIVDDDANNHFAGASLVGDVTVTYTLTSYKSTAASIDIEYCSDYGGSYSNCTRQGSEGDAETPLTVDQNGESHTFVWDTSTDLGKYFKGFIYLRIKAYDRLNCNGDFNLSQTVLLSINNTPSTPTISQPTTATFDKDQTPEVIFDIPDPEGGYGSLHFKIEMDTDSTFGSSNLKIWESRNSQHRECFYYDSGGGTFVVVPEAGVDIAGDPTLIGNDVKFIPPADDALSKGTWYIRATAGDVV